jgi:hypothetical protein
MTTLRFIVLAACCHGCGTTTADVDTSCPIANSVGCAKPRGVYKTTFNERLGGTCGERPDREVEASATRTTHFGPPCNGDVEWSPDYCSASFEVTCPDEETGAGFTNLQISHTNYTEDGLFRTGVYELTIFDANGEVHCQSTYDTFSFSKSCTP